MVNKRIYIYIYIYIYTSKYNKWSNNFDERLHRASCRYWQLNYPFCCVHLSRVSQCFSADGTTCHKCFFLWRNLAVARHLTFGSFGPRNSAPTGFLISRFLHGSWTCPTIQSDVRTSITSNVFDSLWDYSTTIRRRRNLLFQFRLQIFRRRTELSVTSFYGGAMGQTAGPILTSYNSKYVFLGELHS